MKRLKLKDKVVTITDDKGIFCALDEEGMVDIFEAMNTIVRGLNNEDPYYNAWITVVEDEADRDCLRDMVQHCPEACEEAIELFARIVKHYVK